MTGGVANRNTEIPKVDPGVWKQGKFRGYLYWPGVGSDLSRIGTSVKALPTTAGRRKNLM